MPVTIEKYYFSSNGRVPNSRLPLLIYRDVIKWDTPTTEAILRTNRWNPGWHAHEGMWPRHHFHVSSHEFICVTRGAHVVKLGGHDGIYGKLTAGDVVLIPAGVGHCGIQISDDLDLVGGTNAGYDNTDFRMGYPEEYAEVSALARAMPLVAHDPFFGAGGPLARLWEDADRGIRHPEPEIWSDDLLTKPKNERGVQWK